MEVIRENEKIFVVDNDGNRKRVKIRAGEVGGSGMDPIDWYGDVVTLHNCEQLQVEGYEGIPYETSSVVELSFSFEEMLIMAGGDIATFALSWASKIEEFYEAQAQAKAEAEAKQEEVTDE